MDKIRKRNPLRAHERGMALQSSQIPITVVVSASGKPAGNFVCGGWQRDCFAKDKNPAGYLERRRGGGHCPPRTSQSLPSKTFCPADVTSHNGFLSYSIHACRSLLWDLELDGVLAFWVPTESSICFINLLSTACASQSRHHDLQFVSSVGGNDQGKGENHEPTLRAAGPRDLSCRTTQTSGSLKADF